MKNKDFWALFAGFFTLAGGLLVFLSFLDGHFLWIGVMSLLFGVLYQILYRLELMEEKLGKKR